MNNASNASGTTTTTMTLLDDNFSTTGSSLHSNGEHNIDDGSSSATNSQQSFDTTQSNEQHYTRSVSSTSGNSILIFNYKAADFNKYMLLDAVTCEDVCLYMCRLLNILPTTRLLFGLRDFNLERKWVVPGQLLRTDTCYCFRMRFKVHKIDTQLQALDANAYQYLYRQMRYDMVRECIPEIRYPLHKDNVMGLGVVDMYIDMLEQRDTAERIEANYKRYLPRQLVKAHKVYAKRKIVNSFRDFRSKGIDLERVRWNYVHEVHRLAPNYLLEIYTACVDYIPGDDRHVLPPPPSSATTRLPNGTFNTAEAHVRIKLDLDDTHEPDMKIVRIAAEDQQEWIHVAKLDNIYALHTEGCEYVSLEITSFPNAYRLKFNTQIELESFITYLAGYIRLTSKWLFDLGVQYIRRDSTSATQDLRCEYMTPSLHELKKLRCHGPIGGGFSFAKIREKRNQSGSYIVRQCEKEYDTYYIDINTKSYSHGTQPEKCKTETFKITHDNHNTKWILHFYDEQLTFDRLTDLAKHIPTESEQKFCIHPSEYDKPPLLLICLPKNLQSKNGTELSDAELQRKRVQIFDPKIDLQWYKNSLRECDNGKMFNMRADWIQQGCKDISVTLKFLKFDTDFPEFMKLANAWSKIYSPQFIKLYGITLSTPYTMIMEHAKYGQLNEFLQHRQDKISTRLLLDVVHGFVRGIAYLQECDIKHGYIRCANLLVTKYDAKTNLLEAKIADPGFPRPYNKADLPWIPFEFYNDMNAAKHDAAADLWAFATTIWEIFARGKAIINPTAESLRLNYNRYGGILPEPDDCPSEMYKIMMDGWSIEPDNRFNHQEIFSRLIFAKETLMANYSTIGCNAETGTDASSLHSEFSNFTEDAFKNGNNANDSSGFSANSTTCDRAPLIRNGQQQRQMFGKHNNRSYFDDTPSALQIPNGKVVFKQIIGEGHYGTVYLGEIVYNTPTSMESEQMSIKREKVAIKTLKSIRPQQLNGDFMREIEIMQKLDHPNIVKIKQWIREPISIIMEYLESGSFIVYLSSSKPNLTNEKLLHFALDIASGMDYLRGQKIIHRDLAARNILVDGNSVKISDFGLAQVANADGYYIAQSAREIPIKWYSPESIKTSKFSFQSDVWSYGVTLFEMFSRGETPNLDPENELTSDDFLNRLESGARLRKPELCPVNVYEKLMLPCWQEVPKYRPNFKMLIDEIQSIINESGERI